MMQSRPAVRVWVVSLLAAALGLSVARVWWMGVGAQAGLTQPGGAEIAALALLALSAAISHIFPIKSAFGGASYRLTSVFVVAGALILSPGLLTLLPVIAVSPDLWVRRSRPRVVMGWIFNVSQVTLSAHLASMVVGLAGGFRSNGPSALPALLLAAATFTIVQELLVGVMVALDTRAPLVRLSTLTPQSLLNNGLLALLGIAVAGLWLARPDLLTLVPLVLVITHRLTRTAQMAHLAEVDGKTGLHTYPYFEQMLEEELARSVPVGRPLALLFLDLDHFKRINDQFGHVAGDAVLRQVSQLISESLRKSDPVARFGGEEFVALLPGTDGDEALETAERLRRTVDQHVFDTGDGGTVRCTVSVGVATFPQDGATSGELIKQADVAMYRAKRTRNAIACAHALPPAPRLAALRALQHGSAAGTAPSAALRELRASATSRCAARPLEGGDSSPAAGEETRAPHATPHVATAGPAPRPEPAPAAGVKAAAETGTGTPNQRAGRVVVWATVAGGALAALWSLAATLLPVAGLTGPIDAPSLAGGMDGGRLLVLFVALACAGELLKVDVYRAERRNKMSFSFGMAVCLAAVTALPAGAPLVNLAAAAVHVLLVTRQRNVEKALFNLANVTLAAGAASGAYLALAPAGGPFGVRHLLAALAAVAVHYAVNSGLLSLVVSLYAGRTLRAVLRESLWYSPIKIFLGLTGAFLGGVHAQIGMVGVAMFVVPLLLLRYSLSLYANQVQRTIGTLQQAKTDVEQARDAQEETVRELVQTVAMIIDARDNSVSGHSRRVARYATAIGKEMGLAEPELDLLYTAGLFHDLGKVGIPETILHKPARLTEDEYQVVKEHAQIGERLLSEVPLLAEVARMVGEHHERFDGTGYPRGQHGHQTSLGGRILVVADSMESMLANRPYAKGKTLPEAVRELQRCAGAHFDPEVVAATRRAIAALGADFFTGPADGSDGTSSTNSRRVSSAAAGAADRILREVFA